MTRNVYSPPNANVEGQPAAVTVSQETNRGHFVSFDDLSPPNKWRFLWGFFWRSLCAALASFVGGIIVGAVIGFMLAIVSRVGGIPAESVRSLSQILGGIAGIGMGLLTLWCLVRWYFRANWFGHRLVLVREGA